MYVRGIIRGVLATAFYGGNSIMIGIERKMYIEELCCINEIDKHGQKNIHLAVNPIFLE